MSEGHVVGWKGCRDRVLSCKGLVPGIGLVLTLCYLLYFDYHTNLLLLFLSCGLYIVFLTNHYAFLIWNWCTWAEGLSETLYLHEVVVRFAYALPSPNPFCDPRVCLIDQNDLGNFFARKLRNQLLFKKTFPLLLNTLSLSHLSNTYPFTFLISFNQVYFHQPQALYNRQWSK